MVDIWRVQEPALLDIGFGIAARTLGHEPAATPDGNFYRAVLAGLLALVTIGLAAVVRCIRLLGRPVAASRRRTGINLAVWLLVLGTVLAGLGIALPASVGIELLQLILWTPDIAGLVFTVLVLGALLLPLRFAVALRAFAARR